MTVPAKHHTIALDHEVTIESGAELVYSLVSDVTRIGDWSPECIRCVWTTGDPGRVGSTFVGSNFERDHETGQEWRWDMECEVIVADPPTRFGWTVLTESWDRDTSVWTFVLEPDGERTVLRQSFRTSRPPKGFQRILDRHGDVRQRELIEQRRQRLDHGMKATLAALRTAAEAR